MTDGVTSGALLRKTASGTGWVIGWRMATRLLGVISTLVLVRLLLPADFGLVALGTGFAQGIDQLSWLGVEEAVIRHKAPTPEILNTGFTLNAIRGLATGLLILALAVPAGDFFNDARLTDIVAVLALASLLDGLANIGTTQFRRDFAFGKEFRLWILPRIAAALTTMAVALIFRSYWALVAGILTQRVLLLVFSYQMHPFRPRFAIGAWRSLIGYSLWSWALGLVSLARDRSDSMMIGRLVNPTGVGLYALGLEIGGLPGTELVAPLSRAAFSGFAAGRNADLPAGATYLRITGAMALLTLPAGMGISLVAAPLIRLAFGPLWDSTVPLVQVFGLAGMSEVFGTISATLFSAQGLMSTMFRISVTGLAARLALLVLLIPVWGVFGAAIAVAAAMTLENLLFLGLTMRHFAVRLAALLPVLWRGALATGLMALGMVEAGFGWQPALPGDGPVALVLLRDCAAGAAMYGVALGVLWLAAGRPAGPETDLGALIGQVLGRRLTALRRTFG